MQILNNNTQKPAFPLFLIVTLASFALSAFVSANVTDYVLNCDFVFHSKGTYILVSILLIALLVYWLWDEINYSYIVASAVGIILGGSIYHLVLASTDNCAKDYINFVWFSSDLADIFISSGIIVLLFWFVFCYNFKRNGSG